MQVCQKSQCPFSTADSENLQIPQYKHSVVMGVNKAKVPGKGSAFFFHTTDGGTHRGLCGDRRCHAGADHPLAAAWCGDRDRQVTPDLDCELCDGFSACCVVRFTFGVNRPARGPA